jgi:3-methyladenine DNA glycosylase AlkD
MGRREALRALAAAGRAQNRKVYARHGIGANTYGVSQGALRALAKRIGTAETLAEELWMTGNHDARALATMIADPERIGSKRLEAWARGLDNYVIADAFAGLVARTPFARNKASAWSKSPGEWIGRAGWRLVAHLALDDPTLEDSWFAAQVSVIELDIHDRKNRVRDAMNGALIAIGCRNPKLTHLALAAASRIGSVAVDHGETGGQTPDAADSIRRALAHRGGTRKSKPTAPRRTQSAGLSRRRPPR